MKAATGELNLTIITVIAIGLIAAALWLFLPQVWESIERNFNNQQEPNPISKLI